MSNIGHHVSKDGKEMHEAVNREIKKVESLGVETKVSQIFVVGPRNAKETLSSAEKQKLREITNGDFKLYVHSSYITGLWGSKPAFAFHLAKKELEICNSIGASGYVLHIARKAPSEIARVIADLIPFAGGTVIFLETHSLKSSGTDENPLTYENGVRLGKIFQALHELDADTGKVGICIDTAHLWAAGANISSYALATAWINDFTRNCRTNNVLLHFNDQTHTFGGGRDAHAPLLYGTIWSTYGPRGDTSYQESGAYAFLNWIDTNNYPAILERKPDTPKINGHPAIDNIESDYILIKHMRDKADNLPI